jgi:hypothetical protein
MIILDSSELKLLVPKNKDYEINLIISNNDYEIFLCLKDNTDINIISILNNIVETEDTWALLDNSLQRIEKRWKAIIEDKYDHYIERTFKIPHIWINVLDNVIVDAVFDFKMQYKNLKFQ